MSYTIRLATSSDIDDIDALMKRSMISWGPEYYTSQQISSCCLFVCLPDKEIIGDRTFYVVEDSGGILLGCGGWSRRKKLYAGPKSEFFEGPLKEAEFLDPDTEPARIRAMFVDHSSGGKGVGSLILETAEKAAREFGFTRGSLGAMLSGLGFYEKKGWRVVGKDVATLPDDVDLEGLRREKIFA
tara:strand:- start:2019 stop:2573 length:555 start_codon:yes stop_codon:yes gene_type:complete